MLINRNFFVLIIFLIAFNVTQIVSADNIHSDTITASEKSITYNSLKKASLENSQTSGSLNLNAKENYIEKWKTKCSFQLLRLLENINNTDEFSKDSIQAQLTSQQLYIPANHPFLGNNTSEKDCVFIELKLQSSTGLQNITPYLLQIVDQNTDLGVVVAYVLVENIQTLAQCEEILSLKFVVPSSTNIGSAITEGDKIHRAFEVKLNTPFRGNGIKVGVISDSVDHLAEAQARGDLPYNVHVLRNNYPFIHTDEGIAMLEIIHDIAPEAELYFHDSGTSTGFITAIEALSNAGCNIICDDMGFPDQPFFEDGQISARINEILLSKNIIFISSAGNYADKHFQGLFYNSGDGFHDFSRGGDSSFKHLYFCLGPWSSARVILQWNDKWGESNNDYDLGIYDYSTNEYLDISCDIQNGDDDPFEICYYQNPYPYPIDVGIVVEKMYYSQQKILEVYVIPNNALTVYPLNIIPSDSIFGHPAVNKVIAVGAIDSQDPGNDNIAPYSSQGPVTIFYPYSESRKKPDICGIDNVQITGVGGFSSPFIGTSAAAPHIAGIVALVLSANPSLSADEIRTVLLSSADDLGWSGWDCIFGYGRANAQEMLALISITQPTTSPPTTQPTTSPPTTQPTTSPPTTQPTTSPPTTQPTTSPPQTLIADFTNTPSSGVAPLTVRFQDKSQGNPTGWMWDINGDGFRDYSEQSFEHTYSSPGIYSISLSITRGQELATTHRPNYIQVFSETPTSPVPTPSIVDLTIDIHPGWNFISTPQTLAERHRTAGEVFAEINTGGRSVFRYNSQSQSWIQVHSQNEIQPLQGIWIYSVNSTQIRLIFSNDQTVSWSSDLSPGWNAIGFAIVDSVAAKDALISVQYDWTQLIGFNSYTQMYENSIINGGYGSHSDANTIHPGKGYWLFMNRQGILI